MATKKSIKGTQTEKNLVTAYAAESMAYSRYTYYAKQADKEDYYPIGEIFRETADNELHHGKVFFKFLEGGNVEVPLGIDAGVIGDTASNLETAMKEEENEGVKLYTEAAKVADEEGFPEIADRFRAIATIENHHRERFNKMRERIENGTVWKSDKPVVWQCLVCGYITEGTEPPVKCPACYHPQQHFMRAEDNV